MAWSRIGGTIAQSANNTNVTTSGIDTTGANLIVLCLGGYFTGSAIATPTDSKGNTWTPLTARTPGGGSMIRFWYCYNPTVGTGHTFSTSQAGTYPTLAAEAWSGAASSPFDQENGSTGNGITKTTGSITPTQDNELLIFAASNNNGGSNAESASGGETITETQDIVTTANAIGFAVGYIVQTTATSEDITFTGSGSTDRAAEIASFKMATGGGGGSFRNFYGSKFYGAQYAPVTPMEKNLAVARYQRERAAEMRRFMAKVERRAA